MDAGELFVPFIPKTTDIKRPANWPGPEDGKTERVFIQLGTHPTTQAWWHYFCGLSVLKFRKAERVFDASRLGKYLSQDFVNAIQCSRTNPDKLPPNKIYQHLSKANNRHWTRLYQPLIDSVDKNPATEIIFTAHWRDRFDSAGRLIWENIKLSPYVHRNYQDLFFKAVYDTLLAVTTEDCEVPFSKHRFSKANRLDLQWTTPRAEYFMHLNMRLFDTSSVFVLLESTVIIPPHKCKYFATYRKGKPFAPDRHPFPTPIIVINHEGETEDIKTFNAKQLELKQQQQQQLPPLPAVPITELIGALSISPSHPPLESVAAVLGIEKEPTFVFECPTASHADTVALLLKNPTTISSEERRALLHQIVQVLDTGCKNNCHLRYRYAIGNIIKAEQQSQKPPMTMEKMSLSLQYSVPNIGFHSQFHRVCVEFPGVILLSTSWKRIKDVCLKGERLLKALRVEANTFKAATERAKEFVII